MNDQDTRGQLQARVLDRAATDPRFRQQLIQNPRQALSDLLGAEIPANVDIKVVEETPTTFYVVLPPSQTTAGQELSEQDLAGVAGGWTALTDCNFTCGRTCQYECPP